MPSTGRAIRFDLRYEPTPPNAPRFAQDMVDAAREISGIDLDWTPASLHRVDRIVGSFVERGDPVEAMGATLFGFGCYVGEVFVRSDAWRWAVAAETEMAGFTGTPLVVVRGSGRVANPIDKVFKRAEHGLEHDLAYFFHVMTGREVPRPPGARTLRSWLGRLVGRR